MKRCATERLALLAAFALAAASGFGAEGPGRNRPGSTTAARRASAPAATRSPAVPVAELNGFVNRVCAACHNPTLLMGNLSLRDFDVTEAVERAEVAEKMIRKLRAGLMPPPEAPKPPPGRREALAEALESRLDRAAAARPDPGWRPFQRLNRAEYTRAIKDLLGLEIDVAVYLPPDTISHGFDNVADAQAFSPALMEGYLRAASRVSSLAVGDPNAAAGETTYRVDRTASQNEHVPGAPLGTRGGLSVVYTFPADGEYSFRIMLHSIPTGQLFGSTARGEQIEVSIDGERASLLDINYRMSEADPNGMNIQTPRIHVRAGPRRVSAAFIQRFEAPVDDLIAPIDYTLADTQIGSGYGVTALPHLRELAITGPHNVTGVSETPTRRRIFTCRPTLLAEEASCAAEIVQGLLSRAYRGPVSAAEVERLLAFYRQGREGADFESGVRLALQAILASPRFLFRIEPQKGVAGSYRIGDLELASRLSYFLWGAAPDDELLNAARQGLLATPAGLRKQVRRMLADSRSEALATRFAAQWLRLQDLDAIRPDALLYPHYDATLAAGFRRETELLFDSVVREDRSVFDVLTADYSFVNERVARHYGIPNVTGPQFRRVDLTGTPRRGILGHGSILALTSVADRTSPVLRGKWVMEVLLGTPPPPPPPDVPELDASSKPIAEGGRTLSVRERMEEHRRNPACRSCHRVIDPLGLALENFDVDGRVRIRDNGVPVDPVGTLYDGTVLHGPDDLRKALLGRPETVLRNFAEYLMTYALGRRLEASDMPQVRAIVREARRHGDRFSAFAIGIVESSAFRRSSIPAAATAVAKREGTRTPKGF
jgi:hypothetical protein